MKKHLVFNANMIIAGLTGVIVSARIGSIFDKLYNQNELTSLIVSSLHFIFAFLIFSSLHYITNRKKYKSYFGKQIWVDLAKIYGTFIPSLIIFYILFFLINDLMLNLSFSVLIAGIFAWIVGTLTSRIVHTFLAHKAGVFKE